MNQKTQKMDTVKTPVMYMAMELSKKTWKLGFGIGEQKHRIVNVEAGDLLALELAIEQAKERFQLPHDAKVRSCYEAGRDAFWIHRALGARGIDNLIIDPASIETSRRGRRVKTDRVDVKMLLRKLTGYHRGDEDVWSVVRVPSLDDEDERRSHRELERLKKERTAHRNRIQGLLVTLGVHLKPGPRFIKKLSMVRLWNGEPVPPHLKAELEREYDRFNLLQQQVRDIEQQQNERLVSPKSTSDEKAARMAMLKGIGPQSGWVLSKELFGWREFNNRKQVGALVGLTPTPFDSGQSDREQGISKSGSRRLRTLMLQLAWFWLRYQPNSKLTCWFNENYGAGTKRNRRVGIVAVARKLLVALWKYVERGELPEGAELHNSLA